MIQNQDATHQSTPVDVRADPGLIRWKTFELRKIADYRGNLTPIEGGRDISFNIARVYYIYDIPSGSTRAAHAHKGLEQIYIAISGSFDVALDDGDVKERITLNLPNVGLYIGPGVWREIVNFSAGAVCLVLASNHYEEADYLRTYEGFRKFLDERDSL